MRIVVVGDTLLDIDLAGHAGRLCPDGPAPVVDVQSRRERAGGAGLVATLLAQDGHDVDLVTALSDDSAADRVRSLLPSVRLHEGVLGGPTPTKMRVAADGQRVARIDEGCGQKPFPLVDESMLVPLEAADAIVVADYGRRLLEAPPLRAALEAAARRIPVVWDPHPHGARPMGGAAAVTPNLSELLDLSGRDVSGLGAIATAAGRLRERWHAQSVVVTLAERGALLCSGGSAIHIGVPSAGLRIDDSCGAGDRFASALAAALAGGSSLEEAVETAVATSVGFLAAGGVAALDPTPKPSNGQHPAESVGDDESPAFALARRVRAEGGRVVAAGGCFDLLHAGHLRLLEAARGLGDCLIVCLNSDSSVRRLKGEGRPVMDERDRADLLLGLSCVDAVEIFSEDTPERLLAGLRPDVWVKGSDYDAEQLPESALLRRWGGEVVTVPLQPGRSTTSLASAIAALG
ncbi:D-glycero-beta-D-manno-heptose 1-phosphate adenylyltransferase [Sinomonas atrocyanea]|uniref:D-glycero-beta-D-manno-heptose 1-phosphate adenylyltransferase n=1 Tax=Sinomonas atrocyanea TaxID=37927 RepID=UPI003D99941E